MTAENGTDLGLMLDEIAKQIEFGKRIPVGSVVWMNSQKITFGTTIGGKYYSDYNDGCVSIINVDGKGALNRGTWRADGLILKEEKSSLTK